MLSEYIDFFKGIFDESTFVEASEIDRYVTELEKLDKKLPISNSFYVISNLSSYKYQFVSKNYSYVMGHSITELKENGLAVWLNYLHPEDRTILFQATQDIVEYTASEVLAEDRKNLHYTFSLRVKNSSDTYVKVLHHFTPIFFCNEGRPVTSIVHCTMVGDAKDHSDNFVSNIKILDKDNTFQTLFHKNYTGQQLIHRLSKREVAVLRLLNKKYSSKKIAQDLFISENTVNTHRRNILKKLEFSSTDQVVQYFTDNNLDSYIFIEKHSQ